MSFPVMKNEQQTFDRGKIMRLWNRNRHPLIPSAYFIYVPNFLALWTSKRLQLRGGASECENILVCCKKTAVQPLFISRSHSSNCNTLLAKAKFISVWNFHVFISSLVSFHIRVRNGIEFSQNIAILSVSCSSTFRSKKASSKMNTTWRRCEIYRHNYLRHVLVFYVTLTQFLVVRERKRVWDW